MMRWYCTGTSIACVARCRCASSRNFSASNFAISTTVPPRGQRREETHQRRVRIQRRRADRHAVAVVAASRRATHVRPAHAMRLHDALRRAGRARRVDDVERRAGIDRAPAAAAQPAGASQSQHRHRRCRRSARAATRCTVERSAATGSSRNRIFAPQSASIVAKASGVDDGASGATATPARSAPRKIAPYSTHDAAQIAMTSPD